MENTTRKHWVSVAAAVVDREGRVLAIRRRDNNRWEPPGGTLELAEGLLEGLRRELREETGLDVEPGPLTGVYKNMVKGIVALVFRCESAGSAPAASAEAAEVRWMEPADIEESLDPAYACRLLDALTPGSPKIRTHDGVNLLD